MSWRKLVSWAALLGGAACAQAPAFLRQREARAGLDAKVVLKDAL